MVKLSTVISGTSPPTPPLFLLKTQTLLFFVLFYIFLIDFVHLFFTHKTFHLHLQTRLNNGLKPCLKPHLSPTPTPLLCSLKGILNQL